MVASIFLSNVQNPIGVFVDASGNVYFDNTQSSGFNVAEFLSKFSANRAFLGQTQISTSFFDTSSSVRLALEPTSGFLLGLRPDGGLIAANPNTLQVTSLLSLSSLAVDATAVFDVATGLVRNLSGFLQAQFFSYGDIALRQNGNTLELYVTGLSQAQAFPFVMRVRITNGAVQEAKVLLSSTSDSLVINPQTPRLSRGIAVNPQGTVLTTLPVPSSPLTGIVPLGSNDVPIAFGANLNPSDGISPGEAPFIALNGIDLYSQGMTTDASGNFYIVTNSVGSAALGAAGEGVLVVAPPTLNRVIGLGRTGAIASSFRDVAVSPVNQSAYVSVNTFSVIPASDDFIVTFSASGLENVVLPAPTPAPTPSPTPRVIRGNNRNNRLVGTGGEDTLLGLGGNDTLIGRAGNDVLDGGAGNNTVVGGAGSDRFLLTRGAGRTLIKDFRDGQDLLGLPTGVRANRLRVTLDGRNTQIGFGADLLAVLNSVNPRQITAADFVAI